MKDKLFLLLISCGFALSNPPQCCPENEMIMRATCESGKRIKMNCTSGRMILRNVILDGYKVSTIEEPSYVYVEDPAFYCLGEMYRNNSQPSMGTTRIAIVCFDSGSVETADESVVDISVIFPQVSVLFFIITLGVYMYLPQLRDLQGMCYMSMCVSTTLAFLCLGFLQLDFANSYSEVCIFTGYFMYFWLMATFFWTNVISINVYRTVQNANYLKKTEKKQYLLYSCYAWGGTTICLIIALTTHFVEGDHYKPGIGDGMCWFSGLTESWIFFYGPIGVLVASSIALYLISSLKLWRQTNKYEEKTLNKLRYKFFTSLELFLVKVIFWTFEIASIIHGQSHILWTIMDTFNSLQGVVIFLILVVFRKSAIQGLASKHCCLPIIRPMVDKLNPHDNSDDQQIL